jgi:type II secretory pathway pseudopilin PulG
MYWIIGIILAVIVTGFKQEQEDAKKREHAKQIQLEVQRQLSQRKY